MRLKSFGCSFIHGTELGDQLGPDSHPLEAAHQAAGDYMIKVFDRQKINDLAQ